MIALRNYGNATLFEVINIAAFEKFQNSAALIVAMLVWRTEVALIHGGNRCENGDCALHDKCENSVICVVMRINYRTWLLIWIAKRRSFYWELWQRNTQEVSLTKLFAKVETNYSDLNALSMYAGRLFAVQRKLKMICESNPRRNIIRKFCAVTCI